MQKLELVLADIALLVARVVLGGLLIIHGWLRWQVEGIGTQTALLAAHGVRGAQTWVWAFVGVGLVGGLLVLFGLGTRLWALFALVEQVLLIVWLKVADGPLLDNAALHYRVVLATLALVLVCLGAGRAGVDAMFRRPATPDQQTRIITDSDPA